LKLRWPYENMRVTASSELRTNFTERESNWHWFSIISFLVPGYEICSVINSSSRGVQRHRPCINARAKDHWRRIELRELCD